MILPPPGNFYMMSRRMGFSLLLYTLRRGISATLWLFGRSVYKFCLDVLVQRRRCGSSIETHLAHLISVGPLSTFLGVLYSFAIFKVHLVGTDLREKR
jgi:hypothetical protein